MDDYANEPILTVDEDDDTVRLNSHAVTEAIAVYVRDRVEGFETGPWRVRFSVAPYSATGNVEAIVDVVSERDVAETIASRALAEAKEGDR